MIEWLKSRFASPKPKPRKQIDSIVAGIMARKLWEEQRIDHEPIAGKEMAKPS